MRNIFYLQIILASLMLTACATSNPGNTKSSALHSRSGSSAERLRLREESLQDRKDKARILSKKNEMGMQARAIPQHKRLEFSPELYAQANKMGERDLYAEMLNSYNRNDQLRFQSYYKAFRKKYSKAPLADDAIYLNGMFALSDKQYGRALSSFNEIMKSYPHSNKATAAMYAKGVALKRMNLNPEARQAFSNIVKKYPGSPEALRARVELEQVK